MSLAFIFPGQGSQAVGMGAELAEAFAFAREVFQEVDEALSLADKVGVMDRGQLLQFLQRQGSQGAARDGLQRDGGQHAGHGAGCNPAGDFEFLAHGVS